MLPLGISFYTFQSMGYVMDVYREIVEPEKNFLKVALFVSFFPQIIQGPIAIYDKLAGQLYEGHSLRLENLQKGALLVLWGVMKKLVIADRAVLAPLAYDSWRLVQKLYLLPAFNLKAFPELWQMAKAEIWCAYQ